MPSAFRPRRRERPNSGGQGIMSSVFALFDLDGVLLDTEGLYTRAAQEIVGRYGKTYDWSLKKHMIGRDARTNAARLMAHLEIPLSGDEYLALQEPILESLFAA